MYVFIHIYNTNHDVLFQIYLYCLVTDNPETSKDVEDIVSCVASYVASKAEESILGEHTNDFIAAGVFLVGVMFVLGRESSRNLSPDLAKLCPTRPRYKDVQMFAEEILVDILAPSTETEKVACAN